MPSIAKLLKANDKYRGLLQQPWHPGDTVLYVDAVPNNVPTILVAGLGTEKETVFQVEEKTISSLTGVTRLRGANTELDILTPLVCLNNEEFLNQYSAFSDNFMNPRGVYDNDTQYLKGDLVSYSGSSYMAITTTTGNLPTDDTKWVLFSAKGDQGIQGIQGIKGDPGGVTQESFLGATLINDISNTNNYAGSVTPAIVTYTVGNMFYLKATNANTGASTLNVCSLGAKVIKKNVSEDVIAGDIKAGQILPLVYDGTNFQIVGGGGGTPVNPLDIQLFL